MNRSENRVSFRDENRNASRPDDIVGDAAYGARRIAARFPYETDDKLNDQLRTGGKTLIWLSAMPIRRT